MIPTGQSNEKAAYRLPFLLLAGISVPLYALLLFGTDRGETLKLLMLFGGLVVLGLGMQFWGDDRQILGAGITFRLLAFFAFPVLSDDVFRFIWDGQLLNSGVNPFLFLPEEIVDSPWAPGLILFEKLNSPGYHTVYPPVLQGIFALASAIAPHSWYGSMLVMKTPILLAEYGTLFLIRSWLIRHHKPKKWLGWYALNPLAVTEFCGNLHFEALMIFFLLGALTGLERNKWKLPGLMLGLAAATKLIPIMIWPLFVRRLGWRRSIALGLIAIGVLGVSWIPVFFPGKNLLAFTDWSIWVTSFEHLLTSLRLYFQTFEFNAGIYYALRWAGYQWVGYNLIAVIGPLLSGLTFLSILVVAWRERSPNWENLPKSLMWVFLIYYALAPIVHPWYIVPILAFSVLTPYRFAYLWTCLLPLSYTAYAGGVFQENHLLIAIEYLLVGGFLMVELTRRPLGQLTEKPF